MQYRLIDCIKDNLTYLKELHSNFRDNPQMVQVERLEMCQNTAIDVGNAVENNLKENGLIVGLLEKYCEEVFQYSQSLSDEYLTQMDGIIDDVIVQVDLIPRQFRVVFLPYKADMWDSLESIWIAFSKDERFISDVVPIPYYEANREAGKWEARYDGDRFPKDVPVTPFNKYSISDLKPDIAFIHNPFDDCNYVTSVHPDYYSKELKKYVGKLVYVPYYANMGYITDDYKDLPVLHNSDYIIVQSEKAKESCSGKEYYDRIFPLGSPKLDKVVIKCKNHKQYCGKKRIMLNTTINDLLRNEKVMFDKLMSFFKLVKQFENVELIWRPHPLLQATIKSLRPNLLNDYEALKNYFIDNNIGEIDFSGDISDTISRVDCYMGSSYSSVIALFYAVNKPVFLFDDKIIYRDNTDKKNTAEQNVLRPSANGYVACRETAEYQISDFIEDLSNDRLNNLISLQYELTKEIAANMDGTCGQKVYEVLIKELKFCM